ncbi:MAG: ABC transporter substrate-binding protein [Alphaproteobacteria bacterium]|nr:ABC transporter substrate-binding protein [Alphaproteobacteria bacterium]
MRRPLFIDCADSSRPHFELDRSLRLVAFYATLFYYCEQRAHPSSQERFFPAQKPLWLTPSARVGDNLCCCALCNREEKMNLGRNILALALGFAVAASAASAKAQDKLVIGSSAGLTGYLATIDRAWTDALKLASDIVNNQAGVLGRKIQVVIEDNQSQPQDAVTSYRKMISSDHANVFISGCLSAGNLAAVPIVMRQEIPMIVCSIIAHDAKQASWMFSTIPPPAFEVATRMQYLHDSTKIRKVGVIYDQSPYATLLMNSAKKLAPKYEMTVVGAEQYQQSDVDLSVIIKKLQADGAQAILKMGVGPSTLTAAKDMKELALKIPLLTSSEDLAVFRKVAKVLGKDFFFVAGPTQFYDALADNDPLKATIGNFLKPWRAKYGDRDPTWAGRGYDAVMFLREAINRAHSFDGAKIRASLETIHGFQGTSGAYNFDKSHYGVTKNPYRLGQFIDGKLVLVN